MSQLDNTLREAADRNTELLTELSQTDFAPSSLKQNIAYISDLKSQITATEKELSKLHQITEDERKVLFWQLLVLFLSLTDRLNRIISTTGTLT